MFNSIRSIIVGSVAGLALTGLALTGLATASASAAQAPDGARQASAVAPAAAASATRVDQLANTVGGPVQVTRVGTPSAVAPHLTVCKITVYGYVGYTFCEFDYSTLDWGGGNVEYFVVGTDYEIFHAWKGSGGWKNLGGQARRSTPNGAYAFNSPVGVETIGTDNNWYCKYRGNGSWSGGWQRC
ncbi:hypothetical protein F0L68_37900 [Solihabitans fulvus]|uniref:Uncharacterized protein n=1 Tax=Solihabitans fulvus TaxID=1892852 RepID=A0A5B2WKB6_9PSEU|nr:hypothetical protein [Solihabitans fulvus]KAA2251200.1 hypothetical protein F0L68_37900 [Solihabitans fulvus]